MKQYNVGMFQTLEKLGKHKRKINFAAAGSGRRQCIQQGSENKNLGRNSPNLAVL